MIHRVEAEHLLGGFAAGTLTDEEKTFLFEEALRHQELFDALMDEEALRQLLADPEARKALLEVLPETPQPRPIWRSSGFLALAASLFLILTTTLVMNRVPQPQLAEPAATQDKARDEAAPKSHALEAPRPESTKDKQRPGSPPQDLQDQAPRLNEPDRQGVRTPEPALEAAVPAPPPPPPPLSPTPRTAASAAVEVILAPGLATGRLAKEETPRARRDAEGFAFLAPSTAEKKVGQALVEGTIPAPVWSLERLEDGRLRLRVSWSAGHPYLLGRTPSATRAIPHLRLEKATTAIFELTPRPGEGLDLILLLEPTDEPEMFPREGLTGAWQKRVWP